MPIDKQLAAAPLAVILLCVMNLQAQHSQHDHGASSAVISRPRVFLDKSPRIVWYQLNRLSNERLLLVERDMDQQKFIPVWEAILLRPGISKQEKSTSVQALVALQKTDAVTVILDAVGRLEGSSGQQQRAARQLASLLIEQPSAVLRGRRAALLSATSADQLLVRRVAFAALLAAGNADRAWAAVQDSDAARISYLSAIPWLHDSSIRAALRDQVVECTSVGQSMAVRRAAIAALAYVPVKSADSFRLVAQLVETPQLEEVAVQTLLKLPVDERPPDAVQRVAEWLVEKAEATPVEQRTSDAFLDAMQLADQCLPALGVEQARAYRERLRAITVRVVRIRTVEEEMRYDTRFFAVEAGRPVQVVLQNDDLMPHNFVLTVPGALREVAQQGAAVGPNPGYEGKQYVPDSDSVLVATHMVQAGQQERLTFTAPSEPGEYPYVCTFPRHWMRMYGVMVVVSDLDAWSQQPQEPADPLGSNRSFVSNWSLEALQGDLQNGLRGRTSSIGERLFAEASCAQCHKVQGKGGAVGPELTDVLKRWRGDHAAVLREILDPSYKVDPKYAVQVIYTADGKVISGVVVQEDKQSLTVVSDPESPRPQRILRDEIDEIQKTATSLMPKGLLDRFTRDEIFEILAFLAAAGE